jgi:hypothetical protein
MTRGLRTRLWRLLCEIDGVDEGSSAFAEGDAPALWVDGTQVAHFVGDDALEVRLTKKWISADRAVLKADPRVTLRKNTSDWLVVKFSRTSDLPFVRELVATAVDAHKPSAERPSRPPPAGAELARRRRFH